jgi:ATP-dependent DNA helicase RecG
MPDIKFLKGVGPAKAILFNGLDIYTVSDLLHYYPRDYQDRRQDAPASDFKKPEAICTLAAVINTQHIPTRYLSVFKAFFTG